MSFFSLDPSVFPLRMYSICTIWVLGHACGNVALCFAQFFFVVCKSPQHHLNDVTPDVTQIQCPRWLIQENAVVQETDETRPITRGLRGRVSQLSTCDGWPIDGVSAVYSRSMSQLTVNQKRTRILIQNLQDEMADAEPFIFIHCTFSQSAFEFHYHIMVFLCVRDTRS